MWVSEIAGGGPESIKAGLHVEMFGPAVVNVDVSCVVAVEVVVSVGALMGDAMAPPAMYLTFLVTDVVLGLWGAVGLVVGSGHVD